MTSQGSQGGVNLEHLRTRLKNLGVDWNTGALVSPAQLPAAPPATAAQHQAHTFQSNALAGHGQAVRRSRPSSGAVIDSHDRKEVAQLLDKVHRVEAAISSAEALASGAARQVAGEIADAVTGSARAAHQRQQLEVVAAGGNQSRKSRSPGRPQPSHSPGRAGMRGSTSAQHTVRVSSVRVPAAQEHMKGAVPHTPLSSVLSQMKEAETAWAQEKARLRREAVTERKRANKNDLDFRKLARLAEHKALDIKALKAALHNRDVQLEVAHGRVKELEEALSRTQEEAGAHIASLNAERDDLKALLLATLQRLEAVDDVVQRADVSTAIMEDKVRKLEEERLSALEAAARARAEVAELTESRRKLQWQSKLLERMSDVQMKHNKRKTDAIKKLLNATGDEAGTHVGAHDGLDDIDSEDLADDHAYHGLRA